MFDDKLVALEQLAWKERQRAATAFFHPEGQRGEAARLVARDAFFVLDERHKAISRQLAERNEANWQRLQAEPAWDFTWLTQEIAKAPHHGGRTKKRPRTPRFDPVREGIDELLEEKRGAALLDGKFVKRDLRVRS